MRTGPGADAAGVAGEAGERTEGTVVEGGVEEPEAPGETRPGVMGEGVADSTGAGTGRDALWMD